MKRLLKGVIILLLSIAGSCFAQETNFYSKADKKTTKLLNKVDTLITEQKYKSSFTLLNNKNNNPYIIAKKIEICDKYYVKSILHQMFSFVDLKEGETLDQLRQQEGDYEVFNFDPQKIVDDYEAKNGKQPLLQKSLGDYYFNVYINYNNDWILPNDQILQNLKTSYQYALENDCYDFESLSNYSNMCLISRDFNKSIEILTKIITLYPEYADPHYNLAYAYITTSNYKEAAQEGEKAALLYNDNRSYQIDAYLLCVDAAYFDGDYDKSLEYLNLISSEKDTNYQIRLKYQRVYLAKNDYENANLYADELFAMEPNNPQIIKIIQNVYINGEKADLYSQFIERNVKKYTDQNDVLASLYFVYSIYFRNLGNKKSAYDNMQLAKSYFIKCNQYIGGTKKTIDVVISEGSE